METDGSTAAVSSRNDTVMYLQFREEASDDQNSKREDRNVGSEYLAETTARVRRW